MCGIAGIVSFGDPSGLASSVRKMTNAMSHRGPDSDGFFDDEHVSLGHRRLSIIDLSSGANQPFHSADGKYVVVFNGEIYNYEEVKRSLDGYHFVTSSDTEVLLASYIRWGPKAVSMLKGMFAFAIWNRENKELFICRDRLGVKPIYFYEGEDCFVFASEIRAILASGKVEPKLDRAAVADYLSFQSFSHPQSPIKGLSLIEPGSYCFVRKGGLSKKVYWDLLDDVEDQRGIPLEKIQQRVRELLARAVERRLVSDVPVGAFLSGGIDSSALVGLMAEVSTERPNTFNISFDEEGFDESAHAEVIAKKFNTHHHRLRLSSKDLLKDLDTILSSYDCPSGDGVNTLMVSRAIRNAGIKVALSGVGGDELFAGYPMFRQFAKLSSYANAYPFTGVLRRLAAGALGMTGDPNHERMASLLRTRDASIGYAYPEFRRVMPRSAVDCLLTGRQKNEWISEYLVSKREELRKLPVLSQVSVAEYRGYTLNTLLRDTDQMSMAVSLEVREPFFDHELISYVLGVPDEYKQSTVPKGLMVSSLGDMLPGSIVNRRKQGFLFPWEHWIKGELREYCEENLKALGTSGVFDQGTIAGIWADYNNGDKSVRWMEIWLLVVLGHWIKKNGVSA